LKKSQEECDFTFVWCYDFNGWVHDKFIVAEKAKVAARMNKLVRSTQGAAIVPVKSPLILQANNQSSSKPSSSYAEYNQACKDAQPDWQPPVERNQSKPLYQPVKPQVTESQPTTNSVNFCPTCGTSCKGMKFCPSCGQKLM